MKTTYEEFMQKYAEEFSKLREEIPDSIVGRTTNRRLVELWKKYIEAYSFSESKGNQSFALEKLKQLLSNRADKEAYGSGHEYEVATTLWIMDVISDLTKTDDLLNLIVKDLMELDKVSEYQSFFNPLEIKVQIKRLSEIGINPKPRL